MQSTTTYAQLPTILQGRTWLESIGWSDSDGVAVDLTGYTARSQFRSGKTVVLDLTSDSETPQITLGGADGTILLTVTPNQTATLPVGVLRFDVTLTDPAGRVLTPVIGEVGVLGTVTQDD